MNRHGVQSGPISTGLSVFRNCKKIAMGNIVRLRFNDVYWKKLTFLKHTLLITETTIWILEQAPFGWIQDLVSWVAQE